MGHICPDGGKVAGCEMVQGLYSTRIYTLQSVITLPAIFILYTVTLCFSLMSTATRLATSHSIEPEIFAPHSVTDVPPGRADSLILVHSTHITIIVRKRRKSPTNPRKPLILLHFRHPCPARESSDNHPGKTRNSMDKGLIRPRQPPQKKAAATNLSQRPKEGVCIKMRKA